MERTRTSAQIDQGRQNRSGPNQIITGQSKNPSVSNPEMVKTPNRESRNCRPWVKSHDFKRSISELPPELCRGVARHQPEDGSSPEIPIRNSTAEFPLPTG